MAQQPKRVARPGRTLVVLGVVIAAMYAVMFLTGNTTPRLGLDLQGGTSVILQPRLAEGDGDVPQSSLVEAVDIIRQRVNGLGVTEADVQTQGDNIVVSVPGATSREAVELVASTAKLEFRPVLQVAAGAPIPEPTATPSSTAATPAPADELPPERRRPVRLQRRRPADEGFHRDWLPSRQPRRLIRAHRRLSQRHRPPPAPRLRPRLR